MDVSKVQPSGSPAENANWLLRQKKAAGFIAMKLDASNRDLFLTPENRHNPEDGWDAIQLEYALETTRNRSRLFTLFCP